MKFKKTKQFPDCKTLISTPDFTVQTREDGKPGLFIHAYSLFMTRSKALKMAWAIIDELAPSIKV